MNGRKRNIEKPKNFKKTIKIILSYLKKYRLAIIFVLIFSIASTIFAIIGPKILGTATTEIFNGITSKINGSGGINFEKLGTILLFMLGLYLLSSLFSFIQSFIMNTISQNVAYNLRKEISIKINKLPMKYFESRTTGDVLSVITNDIDVLSQGLSTSLTQIVSSITLVIGIIIMMFSISPLMTLVTSLILPIAIIIVSFIVKKSQKYFIKQQEYIGALNGKVEETYSGHNIIKAFNANNEVYTDFKKINDKLYNTAWKSQFLSGMMMPLMSFIGNINYVIISILGGYLVLKNRIQVGDILSFIQYSRNFNQPITSFAQISTFLQSSLAAAERVFEFLNEEEELSDKNLTAISKDIKGDISFENVKFGYDKDKIIINNFNVNIKNSQKIAIVGPTGAGKTTIVKLLMRFYDVNGGAIKIDGNNINSYTRHSLRNLFGMVLQDTWIFSGTVKENIAYGKANATKNEVLEASKSVGIDHYIKTLPNGYDMVINEESNNISEGQKQLMTIARVILKDPKFLILDEATSNVDTRTEILIQEAMDKLMEGRTSFIIAHRLSTIKNADLILVMNEGDIVEIGNHQELLNKKGFYYELYNSQFDTVN